MKQLTVRGFDDELSECIRREAEQGGISLSKAALRLLRREAGLPSDKVPHTGKVGTLSRLARLPVEVREQVLSGTSIFVDADETAAWDSTLNDGLD